MFNKRDDKIVSKSIGICIMYSDGSSITEGYNNWNRVPVGKLPAD